jgi:hypothetical protein
MYGIRYYSSDNWEITKFINSYNSPLKGYVSIFNQLSFEILPNFLFLLEVDKEFVEENVLITFTLQTHGVPNNTIIPATISGPNIQQSGVDSDLYKTIGQGANIHAAGDFGNNTQGYFFIFNGVGTLKLPIRNDQITEGEEELTLFLTNYPSHEKTINIKDRDFAYLEFPIEEYGQVTLDNNYRLIPYQKNGVGTFLVRNIINRRNTTSPFDPQLVSGDFDQGWNTLASKSHSRSGVPNDQHGQTQIIPSAYNKGVDNDFIPNVKMDVDGNFGNNLGSGDTIFEYYFYDDDDQRIKDPNATLDFKETRIEKYNGDEHPDNDFTSYSNVPQNLLYWTFGTKSDGSNYIKVSATDTLRKYVTPWNHNRSRFIVKFNITANGTTLHFQQRFWIGNKPPYFLDTCYQKARNHEPPRFGSAMYTQNRTPGQQLGALAFPGHSSAGGEARALWVEDLADSGGPNNIGFFNSGIMTSNGRPGQFNSNEFTHLTSNPYIQRNRAAIVAYDASNVFYKSVNTSEHQMEYANGVFGRFDKRRLMDGCGISMYDGGAVVPYILSAQRIYGRVNTDMTPKYFVPGSSQGTWANWHWDISLQDSGTWVDICFFRTNGPGIPNSYFDPCPDQDGEWKQAVFHYAYVGLKNIEEETDLTDNNSYYNNPNPTTPHPAPRTGHTNSVTGHYYGYMDSNHPKYHSYNVTNGNGNNNVFNRSNSYDHYSYTKYQDSRYASSPIQGRHNVFVAGWIIVK